MPQVWALSLVVASLAIGTLGVLGVWLWYLFEAVARGHAPPAPPPPPLAQAEEEEEADDDKNGLSEAELRRLGGVCVRESEDGEEENETLCPICLDAIEPGRPVRVLPGCNRAFHLDCVDRWLTVSPRCPVCNVWAVPPPPSVSSSAPKTDGPDARVRSGARRVYLVLDEFLAPF